MTAQVPQEKYKMWEKCLNMIYGGPASVSIVDGEWKTGKTDFGLYLAQECKRLDLITKIGSNIMCWEDSNRLIPSKEVEYIDNFMELQSWMYSGYRKMFIFDEAIKSAPSRRAMSQLNTKWLEVIPELSKARMHLVVITQELAYTESSFLHPTFIRARWTKLPISKNSPLYRKIVELLLPELLPLKPRFKVPPTRFVFDPYRSATFKLMPDAKQMENLSLELQIALDYSKGVSTDAIAKKYYPQVKDRTEATRMIRKGLKILFEKFQVTQLTRGYESGPNSAT